jgi:filamentous hemagglutinin family protein
MNKGRYRLVFSDEHGSYVPVSEETSSRGKSRGARALRRLVAAMAAALPGLAIANPAGQQVISGQVGLQTQGSTLNITASDRAIINWKQFSIQPGETTRFIQPNSTSTVLNRVVGQDPSKILGNLVANGRVFLINPNGVLFGAGAKVDTAGLVASTLNIKNEDFLAGRMKFDADGTAGKLRNEGSLKTTGGPLILIATDVENTGLVTAENGDIVLAAGRSVEIADPHQPALRVKIEAGGEAINLGQLIARGGNVGMFGAALTQAGKISATGAQRTADGRIVLRGSKSVTLTAQSETVAQTADGAGGKIEVSAPEVKVEAGALMDASGTQGGRIEIAAEQRATVEGTLRATGHLPTSTAPASTTDLELPITSSGPAPAPAVSANAGRGGDIVVTADAVVLSGPATLNASGDTGGGSILVGGDWQGSNPSVRNAQTTWVGNGVSLLSDALLKGDGGKVVVWADRATAFAGDIWARGGNSGGDGGQVEVSGKAALLYRGRTDTTAARGRSGELLLDPLAIIIQGGSGDGSNDGSQIFASGSTPGTVSTDALGPTVIFESEIEEQSKTTNIILRAQRSVNVGSNQFSYTSSGNLTGETSGQLALASGSSLLIETRNLGIGEGGASAGIDLVSNGWHGSALQIITQGSGNITLQTGYSNGVKTGDQIANLLLPVLRTGAGSILVRSSDGSQVQLLGSSYTSGGAIQIAASTVTGGAAFNATAGTQITGNYLANTGTLTFDGGASSISGTLTLAANLGGSAVLSLGGLDWRYGSMAAGGTTTLTGSGVIDNTGGYKYLARRLDVSGNLTFGNSSGYYLEVQAGGELHLAATGTLATGATNGLIYFTGSSTNASLSADTGASVDIGSGTTLALRANGNATNLVSGSFAMTGAGALVLDSGLFTTGADTSFTGAGVLQLGNATLSGTHKLNIGSAFNWTGGTFAGSGTTVLSGHSVIDNTSAYKQLNRRLEVTGDLVFGNSNGYYLTIGNGGDLHLSSGGQLATSTTSGFIYIAAGTGGAARLSADAGSSIAVGDGTTLTLRGDNTSGNQIIGAFGLAGTGATVLDSGVLGTAGVTRFGGSGLLRVSGGATLNLDHATTFGSAFRFEGGTLAGSGAVDIGGAFTWAGGSMAGSGITTLTGNAVIDNTSAYKYLGRRLDVSGKLSFGNSSGYYLQIGNGGTLHLTTTGQLATSTVNGVIYMAAGAGGAALISADAGAAVKIGDGTTLTINADGNSGNQIGGTFDLTGTTVFGSGVLGTAGATAFTGSGLLRVTSGMTLNLNHATSFDSAFRFENGTLAGSGDVSIGGAFTWAGGTMAGSGITTLTGASVIDNTSAYKFLNRRLDIDGTLTFGNSSGYYLQLNNGGTLHLNPTGQLATGTTSGLIYMAAGAGGTTVISADAGAKFNVGDGTTLTLRTDSNAGNQIVGTFGLTGTGSLNFDSGLLTTAGNTSFTGDGTLRILGSATFSAGHATTFASALRFENGAMTGAGNVAITGPFAWTGGSMTGTGATTLSGAGVIDNTSAYKYLGRRLDITGSLTFGNSSGYYLQILNGGNLHLGASGRLATTTVNGMIYLAAGAGGSALLSADDGAAIQVGDGTTLTLRSDSTAGNRIAGDFALTGAGATHFDSGLFSVNSDTRIDGTGLLMLSGGGNLGGSGVLTIASGFNWTGGTMSGTGKTVLASGASMSSAGTRILDRTLEIAAGASFDIADGVTIQRSTSNGGTGGIVVLGALTKSSATGTGTSTLLYLDLQGNISSKSGILSIYGNTAGTNLGAASFSTSGSGVLRLDSGLFTLTDGQTAVVSAGTLELSGATLSTAGNSTIAGAGTFFLSNGSIDGAGTLNFGSGFNWTNGSMNGSGVTRLLNAVRLTGSNTRLLNRTLEIAASGSLDLGDNVLIQRSVSSGGTGAINAIGSVMKTTGTGSAYLRYLDLSGNISSASGILSIYGNTAGSAINGTSFSTTAGGLLRLDSGLFNLNQGESLAVTAGTLEISGATLTTTGASTINGAGTLFLSSGTINGTGSLTVNSGFDWTTGTMSGTGTTRLNGEGRILSGSTKALSRTLEIGGRTTATNASGTLQIQQGGVVSVLSSGEFVMDGGASITSTGNGRIDNAGLMRKTGAAASALAMPLTNTGTLRVEDGVLTASAFPVNDGRLTLLNGATLVTGNANLLNNGRIDGIGTVNVGTGTLTNAGLLQPGGAGAAGLLTIQGNLLQTVAGSLEADLLGSSLGQQDQLQISGSVALGGNLVITPAAGVTLGAQDRYTVLSCSTNGCLSGSFASIDTNGLTATATAFSNALSFATGTIFSTWTSTSSGFWDVAANWAGGLIPTAGNDVVIDQAGDITVTVRAATGGPFTVNSLFSNENIAIVSGGLTLTKDSLINGTLSVSGGTLTVGAQLDLNRLALSGGTISGGVLNLLGAQSTLTGGGALNSTTLLIGETGLQVGSVYITNGTLRKGTGLASNALVTVVNSGFLEARGTLTLDGTTIRLASTGSTTYLRGNTSVSGTTLNIAGNGTIDFAGADNASNNLTAWHSASTLNIGSGVSLTGTQSGDIYMGTAGTFSSTATATAGRTLTFGGRNWNNAGTLHAAGGTLAVTSDTNTTWASSSTLDLDSGILTLGGAFSTASFNTLARDGVAAGSLRITGALNNTGDTLTLDASTGAVLLSGSITGGTIRANNPAGGALLMNGVGYLVDTTLAGINGVAGSGLYVIDNGTSMEARGTLTLDGATVRLASAGSTTYLRGNTSVSGTTLNIAGNGAIDFAGADNANNNLTAWHSASALNIGSGVALTGTQSGDIYMGTAGTFSGTATAVTAGKTFTFGGRNWNNAGTLHAAGGTLAVTSDTNTTWASSSTLDLDSGILTLGGAFSTASFNTLARDGVAAGSLRITGALNNTGDTLTLDASTGAVLLSGSITGGTIRANNPAGGALLMNGVGYLVDTTLAGINGVAGSGLYVIDNGTSMEARGTLTLDGATVRLASAGSTTYLRGNTSVSGTTLNIAGNGTIDFAGANNASNNFTAWHSNSILNIGSGISLTGTQSGDIYMGAAGTFSGTATAATTGKTLAFNSNGGWIQAGRLLLTGGAMSSATSLTNTGTIQGRGTFSLGTNTLTNTGTIFTDGGVLNLTGNLTLTASSTLRFGIGGRERGVSYDALDVTGSVAFGGTLQASHVNGFVPGSSESFRLLRYGSRNGSSTFATMNVPAGFGYGSYYGNGNYLLGIGSALTGINEWINNSSGDWSTAINWSLGVAPNSSTQTVIIDRIGATPTVTVSTGNWTVGSLLSTDNLSVTGGTLTVAGLTRVTGTLGISGGTLTTQGALDLNAVTLSGTGQFVAQGGGHIASYLQHSGTSTFAGAGLAFDAIDLRSGTVNFNAALSLPSSLLRVAGYTANLNADQGQTLIQIASGTLNLNLASITSDIEFSSGTLNVANATGTSGKLTWTGGNIGGGGTLTVGGVLNIAGGANSFGLDNTTLVHTNASGLSRMAKTGGYFYLNGANAMLRNAADASLTIDTTGGDAYAYYFSGTGGTLQNLGTLNKTGANSFRFYAPTHFDQAGTLNIQQGNLILDGGSHALSGLTTLGADSALVLMGSNAVSVSAAARFTGDGQIQHNGGTTVTLADGARVDAAYLLSFGTLNIAGSATMNGALLWSGGTVTGGGALTVNGVFDQSGPNSVTLDNVTLVHQNASGASRIASSQGRNFTLQNGAVFRNAAGASLQLDVQGANSTVYLYHATGTASRFENQGTLTKTGSGTADIDYYANMQFDQRGTLAVNQGTFAVNGSTRFDGSQQIALDSTLLIRGGVTTLAAGRSVTGAGQLLHTSGSLTLANGALVDTNYVFNGGTLIASTGDAARIGGTFDWNGGTISGGGVLTVSGILDIGGSNSFGLDNTVLEHTNTSGLSRISKTGGYFYLNGANGVLRNAAGASLTIDTSGGAFYTYYFSGTGGTLQNLGTLNKAGNGEFRMYNPTHLDQAGTLNIQRGSVVLEGDGNTLSGTHQLAAGTSLTVSSGTTTATSSAVFTGAGRLSLTGGTLTFADGLNTGGNLQQSSGNFAGTGNNTLSGRYEWTGGNVTGSGTLTVSGVLQMNGGSGSFGLDGRSLLHTNSSGTSSLYKTGGYFYLSNGATFTNAAGAQLYFDTGSGAAYLYGSGTASNFINDGSLFKVGSGQLYGYSTVRLQNAGRFVVAQGNLTSDGFATNAGVLDLLPGTTFSTNGAPLTNTGTISGHGTMTIGGTGLLNQGTVSPGGTGTIGTLRLTGNYAQASGGTLQIERGSAGTDALIVNGSATLGGTLAVSELTGYVPVSGESNVVSANTLVGSFATVSLPSGYTSAAVANNYKLSYAGAICGGICWDGGARTNLWTDAANWTGDLLPGTNDLVFINLGAGTSVLLTAGTQSIRGLETAVGNTLTISGGSLSIAQAATLAGDLVISGGSVNFNAASQIARLLLSAGTFGGSGAVTFTGAGSTWTGGDVGGTGSSILAAGATLNYSAGTRSTARRMDIQQGATFSLDSGVLTTTGGGTNAGVINVAVGATARYGGSASYLLDSTGQFDGGGRIEFINSAVVTSSSTAPLIADSTFTVRVQDSARYTMTTPTSIANLEVAGNATVTAQSAFGSQNVSLGGGTLTLNAGSQIGNLAFTGGTFAGTGQTVLLGSGLWSAGTFTGNLRIASGAVLDIQGTGTGDTQGGTFKKFGAGSLINDGTMNWSAGFIDVVGSGSLTNNGLFDISVDSNFGDRWVGTGTVTLRNSASGVIVKSAGSGETAIGSLGIPGGTANYVSFVNDGTIDVQSGTLRFNIGYSGATGGGSVTHNGTLHIAQNATFEVGTVGAFVHNGTTVIDAGGTLRHVGGFTNTASGFILGLGTIDIGTGASNTLRNDGNITLGNDAHGTLNVTGNYVQGNGGLLNIGVSGATAGQYDKLSVGGSATIDGTLIVEDAGNSRGAITIDIVTAGGGISGAFSTISAPVTGYTTSIVGNSMKLSYGAVACINGGICWDGGAGTNRWTDAANWTGDLLPSTNSLVFINLAGSHNVVLDSGDHTIASLSTTGGNNLAITGGTLTLSGVSGNGSGLASTMAGDLTLGGTGALVANSALNATRFMQGGGSFSGSGTLNVSTLFAHTGGTHGGSGRTVLGNAITFAPGNYAFSRDFEIDGTLNHSAGTLSIASGHVVDIDGTLNWNAGATIAGPGTLNLRTGSTANINDSLGGGFHTLSAVTVNNAGTVNYAVAAGNSRELLINDGTVFNNTGRFNFTGDNVVTENSGNGGNFNNAGTLAKTAGTGSSGFASLARFNNLDGGTVNSGTGTLLIQTAGNHAGVFNLAGNNVRFNGSTQTFANGSVLRGTSNFNGATIRADGNLTIDGTLNWSSGTTITNAGNAGTLTVLGTSTLNINDTLGGGFHTLSAVTVNNAGTVNYAVAAGNSRELLINDGTVFNNTGRFNFTGDNVVTENSGNGGNFNNAGTLAKTAGTGSSGFASLARFNNLDGGTVNSGTGTLLIQTAGNHAGVFNLAGNNVRFNGSTQTFANGSVLRGTSNFNGATIRADGNLTIDGTLNWSSGTTITNSGNAGTLTVLGTSTLNINDSLGGGFHTLSGVTVNNAGTVNYAVAAGNSRELLINDGTVFNNTGRFNFTGDNVVTENSGNGGNFNNTGTLAKTAGTGSSGFASLARFNDQGGSYRADSGTLLLASLGTLSGTMHIADGARILAGTNGLTSTGTIEGSGTLDLAGGTLVNRGILRPGGTGAIGRLTVLGDVTQMTDGRIEAEFAGTATGRYDVLDVRGNTLLDGVLQVQALGSAAPTEGMQLALVTATGTLDTSALRLQAPGNGYSVRNLGSSLSLGYTACNAGAICWSGGGSNSDWFNVLNWTGGIVPGSNGRVGDLVFINLAGGANVVLNAAPPVTIAELTIGKANSLTLTGGVLTTQKTTVNSGGTLSLNGGTLNFGSGLTNDGSNLLNNGTINYDGGSIGGNVFTNNGRLNVLPGSSNLTTTRLNNNGSIVVDASDGTFEFGSGGGMILANNGSVEVSRGTLSVLAHDTDASGPGADSGAWSVDSGATLRFRDAFRDFGPTSSVTGAGDVEFTAFSGGAFNINGAYNVTGTTRISGNTLVNFNHNATFKQLDIAGNVGGSGTLNVLDGLNWTAGTLSGAGRSVVVGDRAQLNGDNLVLDGARLTVAGSGLIGTGTQLAMNGNAQIIVSDGATLSLGSNSAIVGSGSLVNRGTLEGTIGGGSSNVGVLLSNLNVVKASNGSLGLTGGIADTGTGSFDIGAGATMELGGDLPSDIFDRISGTGTLSFSPTSVPVINRTFATQGGSPFNFSLHPGAVLSGAPLNGSINGQAAGWVYTANTGYNGTDSARFTLSLDNDRGMAVFNVRFNVNSPSLVPPQVVLDRVIPPEVVKPPPPIPPVPRIERPSAPTVLASVDELSDIVTASGPQIEQPLRDFRASRLQCR